MSKQNTSKPKLLSWVFILIQAVLILSIIFIDSGNVNVSVFEKLASYFLLLVGVAGLVISSLNLGSSLTALPDPKKESKLNTEGLYKYARHPMYTSVLLICFGVAGLNGSFIKSIFCILLVILFVFKAKYEEKLLSTKFSNYASYAKKTAMFLPIKLGVK